jgi:hypothetical protein
MRITHTSVGSDELHWVVQREFVRDDGTVEPGCHVIMKDALEWRAAEYGVDPFDVETLMDIVLAEPYLTPEDWSTGYRLHDAPDVATARQDHIARCARVKLRHRISTRPGPPAEADGRRAGVSEHPLDPIRRAPGIDPAVVEVKAEHVRLLRIQIAEETSRRAHEPQEDRVARVRRELGLAPTRPTREEPRR